MKKLQLRHEAGAGIALQGALRRLDPGRGQV
jgi:hypothetical protein